MKATTMALTKSATTPPPPQPTTTTTTTTTNEKLTATTMPDCNYSFNSYKSTTQSNSSYSSTDINAFNSSHDNDHDHDDDDHSDEIIHMNNNLKYLPRWPTINLEFHNITCDVLDIENGRKRLLHEISGEFRSNELTAIVGPSGAGKTTLLNILAGYGAKNTSGDILINQNPRDLKLFRKMSRYIMQTDVIDPHFTVMESMMLAANLKLGHSLDQEQKYEVIMEILAMLRLQNSANTKSAKLSGGERKRLCVALELVNNPPVVFLDEPTTGLDDLSSYQCISLLRRIAHAGRTIICSIHTPPAKIFEKFDNVYVLAEGYCAYQGQVSNIVPYLKNIGLVCPLTYNPADFIIEAVCGEYGNYNEAMIKAVGNGKIYRWQLDDYDQPKCIKSDSCTFKSNTTSGASSMHEIQSFELEIDKEMLRSKSSWWHQYKLLLNRMLIQMWRDQSHIRLQVCIYICMALLVGCLYLGVGNDATKALFNFGFAFTIVIAYLYIPMMPVLLQFPTEMVLLKREYFNQWYSLSSYFVATITSKIPLMLTMGLFYITVIYIMSSQPLEFDRFCMLFFVAMLTAQISNSLGILISSRLSLVNGMFLGPVTACPLILLSTYGIGYGKDTYISPLMRFIRNCSYLRHSMEGLMVALYGNNRSDTFCPPNEVFCMFQKTQFLTQTLGFEDVNYTFSIICLLLFYIIFTIIAYGLIKHRLTASNSATSSFLQKLKKYLVKYLNFSSY